MDRDFGTFHRILCIDGILHWLRIFEPVGAFGTIPVELSVSIRGFQCIFRHHCGGILSCKRIQVCRYADTMDRDFGMYHRNLCIDGILHWLRIFERVGAP